MVFIIVHFYHKSATCINKMLEGSPLICDENVFHHLSNNCIVHQVQSNIYHKRTSYGSTIIKLICGWIDYLMDGDKKEEMRMSGKRLTY